MVQSEPGLEQSMYETIIRLEDPYQLSVSEEDMEKCLNYCRLVSEKDMQKCLNYCRLVSEEDMEKSLNYCRLVSEKDMQKCRW